MTSVEENNENVSCTKNGSVESPILRSDHPLQINNTDTCMKVCEYILDYDEEGNPTFGYKLRMNNIRNDRWINSHMRGLMEIWMANMDFQLVIDVDKIIAHITNYVTKAEIKISSNMNKMLLHVIKKDHVDGLTTKAI